MLRLLAHVMHGLLMLQCVVPNSHAIVYHWKCTDILCILNGLFMCQCGQELIADNTILLHEGYEISLMAWRLLGLSSLRTTILLSDQNLPWLWQRLECQPFVSAQCQPVALLAHACQ